MSSTKGVQVLAFIISLFIRQTAPEPIILTGELEAVWVPAGQESGPIVAIPADAGVFEVAGG